VPVGIEAMLKDSRHGKFLSLEVQSGQLLYAIVGKTRGSKTETQLNA
jgi:hypothetical protein